MGTGSPHWCPVKVSLLTLRCEVQDRDLLIIFHCLSPDKELCASKERQDIELAAQRATLQEQRNHIGILDTALTNAQQNIRKLEDELRKKQAYIERFTQLHETLQRTRQGERKLRLNYDLELGKESNRSGSSTHSDNKWQMTEQNQLLR